VVDLDLTTVRDVRSSLPVLAGTKPAAYRTAPRTVAVPIMEEQR
jgi:hypothetical protein